MYNTKQKQTLINYFNKNINKHYTIKEIVENVSLYKIGESTVYRLINKMTEEGTIRRFRGKGKNVLYQYVGDHRECDNHFHLKCTECGLLVHLDCEYIHSLNKHINEHHKFDIDSAQTIFYGVCSDCRKEKSK